MDRKSVICAPKVIQLMEVHIFYVKKSKKTKLYFVKILKKIHQTASFDKIL